ncbi:MAG: hypothetical protein IK045_08555 [Bacteroidales bacterium]|nr:hypothetical protein [Bacteroidales bacterium]
MKHYNLDGLPRYITIINEVQSRFDAIYHELEEKRKKELAILPRLGTGTGEKKIVS